MNCPMISRPLNIISTYETGSGTVIVPMRISLPPRLRLRREASLLNSCRVMVYPVAGGALPRRAFAAFFASVGPCLRALGVASGLRSGPL
jgi:hypothetical protein